MPPLVLHEDAHLLVIHKPAGWSTHAPDPYAGEGVYEWLRHREPRWASLAILHRLDKVTSGLLVFGLTPEANRDLTAAFTRREVHKTYLLATRGPVGFQSLDVCTGLRRASDHYVQRGQSHILTRRSGTGDAARHGTQAANRVSGGGLPCDEPG